MADTVMKTDIAHVSAALESAYDSAESLSPYAVKGMVRQAADLITRLVRDGERMKAQHDANLLRAEHETARADAAEAQAAALRVLLENLVRGLNDTNWSSWQTTAHFWDEFEAARAALTAYEEAKKP